MSEANYYDTLGVSKTASEVEIKKSYRALSFKYHPDRNPTEEATIKIREINDAYEILSDVSKRKQYDLEQQFANSPFGFTGMPFSHNMTNMDEMNGGVGDINQIFSMLFGGGMGHGMGGHGIGGHGMGMPEIRVFHGGIPGHRVHSMNGHSINSQMFRNSPPPPSPPPPIQKPPPISISIPVTLDQSYHGCTLPIIVERWIMIGEMKINEEETVYITIPSGIDDTEIIVLREKGHVADDYHKGDIKVTIQLQNTTLFRRQGLDLVYKKSISLKEALCGFAFEIEHLNGKLLSLNNKKNKTIVRPNYRKIVPHLGMTRDNACGNLIIEFDIDFPESLTIEQIDGIEALL